MKLYDYFRSTASYRVRVALALKGLDYEALPIHLINHGGEQFSDSYKDINPQSLVPSLETDNGIITQSLAIIDYLDDTYPTPSLYPSNAYDKAIVKSLALSIACDIHPLNNLRVLTYLTDTIGVTAKDKDNWYQHWIQLGFKAVESQLNQLIRTPLVCYGENITVADICLIPQVYNAKRFNVPLDDFPLINEINEYCLSLPAFKQAQP